MNWVRQEGIQHGRRKPIPIEVAQLENHPDRFLLYQSSKVLTMFTLLDKSNGTQHYLRAEDWEQAHRVAEIRITEALDPDARRKRLLERVNEVEKKRARGAKNPGPFLYQQIAEKIRTNPGCKTAYLRQCFPEARSLEGGLQQASKRGLIRAESRGRYARWYPL